MRDKDIMKDSDKITLTFGQLKKLVNESKNEYGYHFDRKKLDSLEEVECPGYIKGNFSCTRNNLTSLVGGPNCVTGVYDCSHNKLTSLKGAPSRVDDVFNCSYNPDLKSLAGAPGRAFGINVTGCSIPNEAIAHYQKFLDGIAINRMEFMDSTGHYSPPEFVDDIVADGEFVLYIKYPDYEEADEDQVDDMRYLVRKLGGKIENHREDVLAGEAWMIVHFTNADFKSVEEQIKDEGWSVRLEY